jgi:CheY-like chemotaxis protein
VSKLLLVIDDDPVERAMLERVLAGAGYGVMTAADGQEGLAPAASGRPDLVLLDVMMPLTTATRLAARSSATPPSRAAPSSC